jgi:hypothetical protein
VVDDVLWLPSPHPLDHEEAWRADAPCATAPERGLPTAAVVEGRAANAREERWQRRRSGPRRRPARRKGGGEDGHDAACARQLQAVEKFGAELVVDGVAPSVAEVQEHVSTLPSSPKRVASLPWKPGGDELGGGLAAVDGSEQAVAVGFLPGPNQIVERAWPKSGMFGLAAHLHSKFLES